MRTKPWPVLLDHYKPELDDDGSLLYEGYWFGLPRDKAKLLELEELNLNGYIKSDIPDQIRNLKSLKRLSLTDGPVAQWGIEDVDKDHDCITEIPGWISELENLEVLNLSCNSISFVLGSITKLRKLRELYLSNNRIEFVTTEIGRLQQLEVLWLGANRTALLTDGIKSLPDLKELWLDGLPGSEYGPITLKVDCVVVCTSNGHSAIPLGQHKPKDIFKALEYLESVTSQFWIDELYQWADQHNIPDLQLVYDDTLDHNGKLLFEPFWVGLPRDRHALLGLEELDLSWHSCTEIPEQIRHLKKLKKLRFAKMRCGNQPPFFKNADGPDAIQEIPEWIGELERLEELDLQGNDIIYVPKVIAELAKLRTLYLQSNKIMFVEPDLGALSNLEVLWIDHNYFSVIDDCIKNLKDLANLELDCKQGNRILVLRECIEQFYSLDLAEEKLLNVDDHKWAICSKGFSFLKSLIRSDDSEVLWNSWLQLSDIKSIVRALPSLCKLYCDGLKGTGPYTLGSEGLIETTDEEDVIHRVDLKYAPCSMGIGKVLDALSLWKI
ncbi:MAG: hypothetical protein V7739_20200 [Motiliproteus sp.]